MNDSSPVRMDFAFFCQVFHAWFATRGWSQARLETAGGPSKPVQTRLIAGDWQSTRPNEVLSKVDRGFGWPAGTAWRVLTSGYDPVADPPKVSLAKEPHPTSVGGVSQDASGYVKAPGELVESGVSNEDLLREILRSRAEFDQIRAEQRELRRDVSELSARLEKVEQQGS